MREHMRSTSFGSPASWIELWATLCRQDLLSLIHKCAYNSISMPTNTCIFTFCTSRIFWLCFSVVSWRLAQESRSFLSQHDPFQGLELSVLEHFYEKQCQTEESKDSVHFFWSSAFGRRNSHYQLEQSADSSLSGTSPSCPSIQRLLQESKNRSFQISVHSRISSRYLLNPSWIQFRRMSDLSPCVADHASPSQIF